MIVWFFFFGRKSLCVCFFLIQFCIELKQPIIFFCLARFLCVFLLYYKIITLSSLQKNVQCVIFFRVVRVLCVFLVY